MIRVSNLKLKIVHTDEDIKKQIFKKLRLKDVKLLSFSIIKKSLDARDKDNIHWNYIIDFTTNDDKAVLKAVSNNNDFRIPKDNSYKLPEIDENEREELNEKIVVVGSGPAGLFAAYYLAKNGYRPLLIERGESVENRTKTIENYWDNEDVHLNRNSNVQFGEGGAGTFSDGKLNTGVNDPCGRNKLVLQTFVDNGAKEEILYLNKPHLGTDELIKIVKSMREQIISFGGEVLFNTKFTHIYTENGKLKSIEVMDLSKKEDRTIPCENLILAPGHSARDTFKYLIFDTDMVVESKPFAVGVRIQHSQEVINQAQYGKNYKEKYGDTLPPADYKLVTKTSNGESVYSFCMCPGGYVVNSSSEPGAICVNGMSYSGRDSECANAALVIGLEPYDEPYDNIEYQRELEIRAFKNGGGKIPVQLFEDFEKKRITTELGSVKPCFKGNTAFGEINAILDPEECEALKEAIHIFGKKIKGFDAPDAVIAGVESRTSSPLRMKRDENFESNIKGIFPCGEGAGYAGGITSAAIDGVKVFEEIYRRYKAPVIQ